MAVLPITCHQPDWKKVEAFLEAQTDRVRDLLLWADIASPLCRLSHIWAVMDGNTPTGVAFAFPLWPELATIGLKGLSPEDEEVLLEDLVAQRRMTRGYVICEPRQQPLYETHGTLSDWHEETHLVLEAAHWTSRPILGVRPARLDELEAFYARYEAPAWNPVQFETGPYFVAEVAGEIVAAAGTHFAIPGLAQIGNVLTAPEHRGNGHAERCVRAVIEAHLKSGVSTLSLFTISENAPALRLYERLGFKRLRTLVGFHWEANLGD